MFLNHRVRVGVFALLILVFLSFPVFSESYTLTLEDAVKRAMDQSLHLKKNAIDLAQAGYSAGRLWSEIFPNFSLNAGLTWLPATPLFTDPGFSYRDDNLSYSFTFGISLSLNPSLRSSMRRIDLAYRSQILSYENAHRQLETQVIKSYLSLIAMKENLSNLEQYLEVTEQILEKDRIARANGLLSELSLLNTRLSAETARFNLSNARGNYQNALGEFLALLGMEIDTDIIFQCSAVFPLDASPEFPDPEKLIIEYLPKRPDIISQRQSIERLELSKNITTLSARSPSLELSAQWRGGTPTTGARSGIGDPFTDSVSGSLSLRIPIDGWIPGTRQSQSIRSANAELEKVQLDLQNTEALAKNQIRSMVSNLRNIWENLAIARMRVDIAERTLSATDEGFKNGTVEFRVLEDTRSRLSDARQQLLMGELSWQSLLLDLAAALNVEWKTLTNILSGEFSGVLP